ncbi:transposase [Sedimentitalea sp. HM32M-2]|uniref:transposase n=1 Tax=Sedimentitalea sp. HM32M-2 TaxID=3351566 RepID=UPI00363BC2D5
MHVFVSVPPKAVASGLVCKMKGRSSCGMQREFPAIRRRDRGCRFWVRGIFPDRPLRQCRRHRASGLATSHCRSFRCQPAVVRSVGRATAPHVPLLQPLHVIRPPVPVLFLSCERVTARSRATAVFPCDVITAVEKGQRTKQSFPVIGGCKRGRLRAIRLRMRGNGAVS